MSEEKKSRYTEAQNRATQKYIRENMDEIRFRVHKNSGQRDRWRAAAEKQGLSLSAFLIAAADKAAEEVIGK